ncbi:MAG TPA: hypothetical protein PLI53_10385 [Geobacteraceae bacterium]|nr:hypothetical protein [Geobacteraceae bacterium]
MLRYIAYEGLTSKTLKSFMQMAIELKGSKMAIWKYCNGETITSVAADNVPQALISQCLEERQLLERVTIYNGEDLYSFQDTYVINEEAVNGIVASIVSISQELDSISIYKENEKEWFMSIIFHENMCIIKNIQKSEEAILAKCGFTYSYSPPENW